MARNAKIARSDADLNEKMKQLGTRLRRMYPGCNTTCFAPLHRYLAHFGVEYGFYYSKSVQTYGRTDA